MLAATQMEADEKRFLAKTWWMPYHLGRDAWYPYDTSKAWFWQQQTPKHEVGTGPDAPKVLR